MKTHFYTNDATFDLSRDKECSEPAPPAPLYYQKTSLVKLSQWEGKDPWWALGMEAVEKRKKHSVWNGQNHQFSNGYKNFPVWAISVWAEFMLCWMILTYTDYYSMSLPALYEKANIVMLVLFFCHSTDTQTYRLKRWQANDNMLSSDKGSRSGCKKKCWKLLFEPWFKRVSEPFGIIILLTPRISSCACSTKKASPHFELTSTEFLWPIFLHVHSSKWWSKPNIHQDLFFYFIPYIQG